MVSLAVKIRKGQGSQTVSLEMSSRSFERFAAAFGLFRKEFLQSLARSQRDIREGRVRTITSFKELE